MRGFWGITAFFANFNALIKNIITIGAKKENLLLTIHNSVVYKEEGKNEEALTLALLAKTFANKNYF